MTTFSLYIHYPFCIKRCPYCGFATAVEKEDLAAQYREVLLLELERRSQEAPWRDGRIETIYFGGGTPSLMPPEFTGKILNHICDLWKTNIVREERKKGRKWNSSDIEITLEANPETRDLGSFRAFRLAGINRLSMGAQSFDPKELQLLGRAHSVDGIGQAVTIAREAGFVNLSLDLIYGVPGQTVDSFRRSVEQAIDLGVEHLSTYTLSIEEGTPYARSVREKRLTLPDPDLMADQYAVLIDQMNFAGYEHYELTNYGKPGLHSRHNSVYWQRTPYLGVGCGAHSFDGSTRFWNRRDTRMHIAKILSAEDPREGEERPSKSDILQEQLYLSLRQACGIAVSEVGRLCKPDVVDQLIQAGFLNWNGERLRVTEAKWLMLDEIVLRLQR